MDNQFIVPALIFSVLGLTACGGGGGDSSSSDPVTFTAAARMDLTTVDTNVAAAEGFGSTASTSVGGAAAKGTESPQATNSRIVSVISDFKKQMTRRNKTIANGPESCATSGTREFSYDDVTFAFTMTFQNCKEFGEELSGSISGTFSEGNSSSVFTMNYSNFSIISTSLSESFSMSMNGTMVVTMTEFIDYDRSEIDGSSMVISMNYSGRSVTLGNYIMTYEEYYAIPYYDISTFKFDMNSVDLGGSLHIASTQPVYQYFTDDFPYAGQIKLSAANNGSFLITIIDATSIQLQTDADGDDIYEGNEFITWTELNNYLN